MVSHPVEATTPEAEVLAGDHGNPEWAQGGAHKDVDCTAVPDPATPMLGGGLQQQTQQSDSGQPVAHPLKNKGFEQPSASLLEPAPHVKVSLSMMKQLSLPEMSGPECLLQPQLEIYRWQDTTWPQTVLY